MNSQRELYSFLSNKYFTISKCILHEIIMKNSRFLVHILFVNFTMLTQSYNVPIGILT